MLEEELAAWFKEAAAQFSWLRCHARAARRGSAGNQTGQGSASSAPTGRTPVVSAREYERMHRAADQGEGVGQVWETPWEGDKGFMDWTASKVLPIRRTAAGDSGFRKVCFHVELKSETGKPTGEQVDWLSRTPNAWLIRPTHQDLVAALLEAKWVEEFVAGCARLDTEPGCLIEPNVFNKPVGAG